MFQEGMMLTTVDTEKIIRKTKQYEFSDGLRDIQLGSFFLLLGVTFWVGYQPFWWRFLFAVRENAGRFGMVTLAILLFALPALMAIFSQPLIKYIRKRWLWRESGMVTPLRQMLPMWIPVSAAVFFIVSLIIGVLLSPTQDTQNFFLWNWLWTISGWMFGATLMAVGKYLALPRYTWLGLAGGIASTALLLIDWSLAQPILYFGLGWGLMLLVSGVVVVRKRWPADGEANHDG
jgi:hypothetical protein